MSNPTRAFGRFGGHRSAAKEVEVGLLAGLKDPFGVVLGVVHCEIEHAKGTDVDHVLVWLPLPA